MTTLEIIQLAVSATWLIGAATTAVSVFFLRKLITEALRMKHDLEETLYAAQRVHKELKWTLGNSDLKNFGLDLQAAASFVKSESVKEIMKQAKRKPGRPKTTLNKKENNGIH